MSEADLAQFGFAGYPNDVKNQDEEFRACHYIISDQYPGISLMINYGKLVRIDINTEDWQSFSGAKIGMSETQIDHIYGGAIAADYHPYLGKDGSYLILQSADQKYRMIFETSVAESEDASAPDDGPNPKKKVTGFRAGLTNQVNYIEGCS